MFKFGPLLADCYVMSAVGVKIHSFRQTMDEEIKAGKFKTLKFMHHMTSGLKSVYSQTTYDAIDFVRTNCGGAGFSVWSGLPQQYSDYSPVPTYEGDNTVMANQTINYLLKKFKKIQQGKPAVGFMRYLNNIDKILLLESRGMKSVE